jgi:hypothetical protein
VPIQTEKINENEKMLVALRAVFALCAITRGLPGIFAMQTP